MLVRPISRGLSELTVLFLCVALSHPMKALAHWLEGCGGSPPSPSLTHPKPLVPGISKIKQTFLFSLSAFEKRAARLPLSGGAVLGAKTLTLKVLLDYFLRNVENFTFPLPLYKSSCFVHSFTSTEHFQSFVVVHSLRCV